MEIIICTHEYKEKMLKNNFEILNNKFYTLKEFINNLYFTYDDKTILYLINKYGYTYDIAREYLDNLIYITSYDKDYEKINFLRNIYNELKQNNLLICNDNFENFIKDKKIIIKGIYLNKFEKYLLRNIQYDVCLKEAKYLPKLYKFNTQNEEIDFIATQISKLINNGIDINKIIITNVNEDVYIKVKEIFAYYNLKVNNISKINLLSTILGKEFYNNLNLGINTSLELISKYGENKVYNKIVDVINEYSNLSENDQITMIKNKLNKSYVDADKYSNEIKIVDYKTYDFSEDEYVFMLSFNEGIIPRVYKDNDYITDNIKNIYMDNTFEKNIYEKTTTIAIIKSIKNLTITYKLNDDFKGYYPSTLLDDLNIEINDYQENIKECYSMLSSKIKLISMIDDFIKYGKLDNKIPLYLNNFDVPYNNYNHSFSKINKDKLQKYIYSKDTFELSYSSLDSYNRCNFRFYLEKILGLKQPNQKFTVYFGSIYHFILQKAVLSKIDIKTEIDNYIQENNLELTNADQFFLEKSIKDIEFLLDVLHKQKDYCLLDTVETEKNIVVPLQKNIVFTGFIDKILSKDVNNLKYAAVIDYKTYVKKPTLKYIKYGFENQLFIYMYLVSKIYNNIKFVGAYLQNINLDNKSVEDKEKSLKLIGFSNIDKDTIRYIDYEYEDNNVLEGVKVKTDGDFTSYSYRKLLSDEKINEINKITESVIKSSLDSILNGNFDINPKFDKTLLGCTFCPFKDICFMKDYDINYLNIKEDDEDGMD